MELLDKLPDDLKWNVIKYLKHPVAEKLNHDMNFIKNECGIAGDKAYICKIILGLKQLEVHRQLALRRAEPIITNPIFF
jgi:hypothetical protein